MARLFVRVVSTGPGSPCQGPEGSSPNEQSLREASGSSEWFHPPTPPTKHVTQNCGLWIAHHASWIDLMLFADFRIELLAQVSGCGKVGGVNKQAIEK